MAGAESHKNVWPSSDKLHGCVCCERSTWGERMFVFRHFAGRRQRDQTRWDGLAARPIDSTAFSETGWKEPTTRVSSKLFSRVVEAGTGDRAWAQGLFSGKLTSPTLILLISNYRTASSRPPDPLTSPTSAGSVGIDCWKSGDRVSLRWLAPAGRSPGDLDGAREIAGDHPQCWGLFPVGGPLGGPLGRLVTASLRSVQFRRPPRWNETR
jgi:hypothetical protein